MVESFSNVDYVKNLLQKNMPKGFKCLVVEMVENDSKCDYPDCKEKAKWKLDIGVYCLKHMQQITTNELQFGSEVKN